MAKVKPDNPHGKSFLDKGLNAAKTKPAKPEQKMGLKVS